MSRIPAVDPATAPAPVQKMLDAVEKGLGGKPNLFRVAGNSAASLEALTSLFGAVSKGRFNAKAREAIALSVSEQNGCDYCLSAHSALGKGAGLSDAELSSARQGESADARVNAALRLSRQIVEKRGQVDAGALAAARAAGLTDADLVDLVTNVALTVFTNYLNLVADTEIDFPVVKHHAR